MVVKRVVRRKVQLKKRKVDEDEEQEQEVAPKTVPTEEPAAEQSSSSRLWVDDEDNGLPVGGNVGGPEWAAIKEDGSESDSDSEVSDEDLYQKKTDNIIDRSKEIPHGTLSYQILKDANRTGYSDASINAVDFNPRNPTVLLTASPDHRLRLFQVDGNGSAKLQTVTFDDFPLKNAKFSPDGSQILCGAARPRYTLVDAEKGAVTTIQGFNAAERNHSIFTFSPFANQVCFSSHTGTCSIVSLATHQVVYSLKGDGPCCGSVYHPTDSNIMMTAGGSKVYVWDIRTRRPLKIHQDAGSLLTTSLDMSASHYATGSSSGVVNLYSLPKVWGGSPLDDPPVPVKSFMSLTTELSFTKFNSTGDVLVAGSQKKKNAFRLIHVPSQTVFSNFPRPGRQFRKPVCASFSPSSGLLCLGNDRGKALLFRLNYYENI
eukprot:TRINITY_DN19705_c0_g1_i1.p1 TRINITY_DN19705_c0_g1~~TRINITY_DN19705_c0_g1_i1.p1  ORF type:complete len:451 (+),score=101.55 TRINITY_DN19705_c0_g1_i1:65-1354(+)